MSVVRTYTSCSTTSLYPFFLDQFRKLAETMLGVLPSRELTYISPSSRHLWLDKLPFGLFPLSLPSSSMFPQKTTSFTQKSRDVHHKWCHLTVSIHGIYPSTQAARCVDVGNSWNLFPRNLTGVSGSAKLFPRFNLGRSQLEEVGAPQILSGFWCWFSPTKNGSDFSGLKFQGWKKKQWNPMYFRPFVGGGA